MTNPDYRGIAALAIGVCGAFGVFILVPLSIMFLGLRIGEAGSEIMIALGGALVGAFATYMGIRHNGEKVLPPQEAPPTTIHTTENGDAEAKRLPEAANRPRLFLRPLWRGWLLGKGNSWRV